MSALTGTGELARLALRRDRVRLGIWVLALTSITLGTAAAFATLYPTTASRLQFALGVGSNPALTALVGPLFDPRSLGGLVAWRLGSLGAVLVGLMCLFAVVRHTRAEEEAGRLELVGAGVVGRRAPLTAGLLVAMGAALAVGVVVAGGLAAIGLPLGGSVALGLALTSAGWMFAAIAAVTAQMTEGARAASAIAAAALGASFMLRAAGDSAGDGSLRWLSWLSPIGWTQQVRPFAGERWWVFGLAAALVVGLLAVAYALVGRRDVGAGLLPSRLGPGEASPRLRSPLALAWRLQRGAMAGWALGLLLFGAALGSIALGIGDLLKGNPQLEAMLASAGLSGEGLVDAFLATLLGQMGVLAAAYAVQATLRLRSEETGQRAEPVLATRTGRIRWASSHLAIAALGTVVVLVAVGVGAGISHGLRTGDVGGQVPRLVGAALAQVPAALVLAGLTVALFGLVPRFTAAAWGVLALFLVLQQLGPMLKLDQLVMDLSPFTHAPKLPGGELVLAPLAGLVGVALLLAMVGLAAFRRRDVG
jgi:polyether ionophore transport system permease protein